MYIFHRHLGHLPRLILCNASLFFFKELENFYLGVNGIGKATITSQRKYYESFDFN